MQSIKDSVDNGIKLKSRTFDHTYVNVKDIVSAMDHRKLGKVCRWGTTMV